MTQSFLEMSDFTKKVKDDLRVFNNFAAILDKADHDGYIRIIFESLNEIFKNEINFAIKGMFIRVKKTKRKEKDIKSEKTY